MSKLVIAIDGPAGAGKSTVSKMLARRLGLRYLDTGAMYRALALKVMKTDCQEADGPQLAAILRSSVIAFGFGEPQPVLLDGQDVSVVIRTPDVAQEASRISTFAEVRREMVLLQQQQVADGGVILEGRDTTTVVAPNADVKVYLTASLEERAQRRTFEFSAKGVSADYDAVRTEMETRDHRDISRPESPLKVAAGAVLVETGGRTPEQIVDLIAQIAEAV